MSVSITQLTSISDAQKTKLKQKSMRFMVDSPSSKGLSPQMIKERMVGYVLDDSDSIISLLENVISEVNTALGETQDNVNDVIDGTLEIVANIDGGTITNVTITGGSITGATLSGNTLGNNTIEADRTITNNGTISGGVISGATINTTTLNSPTITSPTVSAGSFANSPSLQTPEIEGGTISGATIGSATINNSEISQMAATDDAATNKTYVDTLVTNSVNTLEASLKGWVKDRDKDHIKDFDISYNQTNGKLTFAIKWEGENSEVTDTKVIDLPLESAYIGVSADNENHTITFTLFSGETFTVDIDDMFDAVIAEVGSIEASIQQDMSDFADAETQRESNESTRISNEITRQGNETTRGNAETTRINQETTRQQQETIRQNQEATRIYNENQRVLAEESREEVIENVENMTADVNVIGVGVSPSVDITGGDDANDPYKFTFNLPQTTIAFLYFSIDLETGELNAYVPDDYAGPTFSIDDKGYLEVTYNV